LWRTDKDPGPQSCVSRPRTNCSSSTTKGSGSGIPHPFFVSATGMEAMEWTEELKSDAPSAADSYVRMYVAGPGVDAARRPRHLAGDPVLIPNFGTAQLKLPVPAAQIAQLLQLSFFVLRAGRTIPIARFRLLRPCSSRLAPAASGPEARGLPNAAFGTRLPTVPHTH
jgi:hypothetical protein